MLKQKIIKIDKKIANIEKWFIIIMVLSMLFLSFFQVILRIFFYSGITYLDVFLRHIVMISALFSASLVSYNSSHFKIEIFDKIGAGEKTKKNLSLFSSIFTILAVIIILIASLKFIKLEFNWEEIKTLNFKAEDLNLFIPLTFLNMLIHTFVSLLKEESK